MPVLHKIVIQDFRNIELQDLSFSPNINCIWGGNGEGKTNLLDAIHYLSMTKSGTQSVEKFNFRQGTSSFAIGGVYDMGNGDMSRFSIKVTEGADKKLKRDEKPYARISDHIGILPIVMVSPADTALVSEAGDGRRRFVNAFISQMDRAYLSGIQQYNRLLAQRNILLKEPQPDVSLLEAIDEVMTPIATALYNSRNSFCTNMLKVVQRYYEAISGGKETVDIEYKSDLAKTDFASLQEAHRERDLVLHYTVSGIHRDDFLFSLDGLPLRRCGSQGQQKSFLVALKFAQYEIMKLAYGFPPILLLDDLFDKLDMTRAGNLLQMVAGHDFGQIFISDTDRSRSAELVDSITADRAYFKASRGTFSQIDGQLQD
ncbi:MAG: DNA replication and repair protein RecF [Bacteroidales bacterium]|nr:DNA replication and repair protein RecF [Bacteroidales bacterium]